jgi:DNA-directed RNA polymerase subunit RPC12/RpoP
MATEKRLIDANDVYSLFNRNGTANLHVADIDLIRRVDAVEVVHGEWSIIEDDYDDATILECSVCEVSFRFDEYDGLLPQAQTYHYCPNCGAKMDLKGK